MTGTGSGGISRQALRRRNLRTVALLGVPLAVMVTLVAYAPALYRLFCAVTGYGGTVQTTTVSAAPEPAEAAALPRVTVYFDANVEPGLPWVFRPMQDAIDVRPGEPVLIHYYAENRSDRPIVGQATFNVTPFKAAPYFFKTECFCFTEERLDPGERAEMPVQFFIDPELLRDPNTREVRQITLSYTFYRQEDAGDGARDLGAGSRQQRERIARGKTGPFSNDAPRR